MSQDATHLQSAPSEAVINTPADPLIKEYETLLPSIQQLLLQAPRTDSQELESWLASKGQGGEWFAQLSKLYHTSKQANRPELADIVQDMEAKLTAFVKALDFRKEFEAQQAYIAQRLAQEKIQRPVEQHNAPDILRFI